MAKQTIVFIHGTFLNPKSWDKWVKYFGEKGFTCVAPPWPYHEGDLAYLRSHVPEALGELDLKTVTDSMRHVAVQHGNPILIGHRGLMVQALINEGIGSMGVAICSVAFHQTLTAEVGY